jgi:hypothetical protein
MLIPKESVKAFGISGRHFNRSTPGYDRNLFITPQL